MASLNMVVDSDGIALLTMDVSGKPMNVTTPELRDELRAAVRKIAADSNIRGAIITSAKSDFMAGGDINAMVDFFDRLTDEKKVYAEISRPFSELLRQLETCGKPFVAAINGAAIGAGLEIALACHYRVASNDPALVISLPEVTIGLMPGAGGSQRLPRLIGIRQAVALMLEGTSVSAEQALQMGIIHEVAAPGQLLERARHWLLTKADAVQPWDKRDYQVPGGAGYFDAKLGAFYAQTATGIAGKTQRNLPAPIALVSAVARGTSVPMDAGLREEARQFTRLIMNPVSRNLMRTQFISVKECRKAARTACADSELRPQKVGVVGAGLMGGGVAQVCASAGLDVVLIDATTERAEAGKQKISEMLQRLVAKGSLEPALADSALSRIKATGDYSQLAGCDLVVEAVFENRQVKADVFRKILAVVSADTVLASNTSSLPVSSLAEGIEQPERFVGLHFFSPVGRMPLVEVIKAKQTSDRTYARALALVGVLKKTPIAVNDAKGFFTTRVISAYLFESAGMLAEGISPVLIDNAALQAGFAIGPLSLIDDLTIELTYNAQQQYKADAADAWVEPHGLSVFNTFVRDLDRKGRRYGSGFYDYVDGKRSVWPGMAQVYAPLAQQPDVEELKTRMLYIQALEAARAFEEGVITNPAHGDVGSVLGIGFPAYTGGVFSFIDTVGIREFVHNCQGLAARFGERYRPSQWLVMRAERDQRFYPAANGSGEVQQ
ncbi:MULTISPECIES: 3-hydroxyacyl-CoA dehydrogenase NAD-binding domain-containing protein [unclassified Pseudomonas]|uniref:3-hydroxyacyl-CoA dehydrogenase NAD-binding domain-containing protein n=1 Tax=unclassified Pseudomonas TaxID=196821 RepID=UPI0039B74CB9